MFSMVRGSFALSFVLFSMACGAKATQQPVQPQPVRVSTSPSAERAELKAPGEAKPGDLTRCPVSGGTFRVRENSPKVEHEGKTYYLCCQGCVQEFEKDPAKYTRASSNDAQP